MVKFQTKIWESGSGSALLTIPKQYVKDGSVTIGEEMIIEINKVEGEKNGISNQ